MAAVAVDRKRTTTHEVSERPLKRTRNTVDPIFTPTPFALTFVIKCLTALVADWDYDTFQECSQRLFYAFCCGTQWQHAAFNGGQPFQINPYQGVDAWIGYNLGERAGEQAVTAAFLDTLQRRRKGKVKACTASLLARVGLIHVKHNY